jgi:polar amino acid transport system substrate-binding protein
MQNLVRLTLSSLLLLGCVAAHPVELMTEDDPPYNMRKNGKVVGIATEKLEKAFKRVGVAIHIELTPWARAYQSALKRPGYCAYSTARTPEREALFKWIGPLAKTEWVLYMRAGDAAARKPASLDDVRGETIGGYLQDVISLWLMEHGYRVQLATSDALNPGKLLGGRFNYWASTRVRASALLTKDGLTKQIVPVLSFGHTDLYLACHRDMRNELVHELNEALRRMGADGTSARIEARYARWPRT